MKWKLSCSNNRCTWLILHTSSPANTNLILNANPLSFPCRPTAKAGESNGTSLSSTSQIGNTSPGVSIVRRSKRAVKLTVDKEYEYQPLSKKVKTDEIPTPVQVFYKNLHHVQIVYIASIKIVYCISLCCWIKLYIVSIWIVYLFLCKNLMYHFEAMQHYTFDFEYVLTEWLFPGFVNKTGKQLDGKFSENCFSQWKCNVRAKQPENKWSFNVGILWILTMNNYLLT